MGKVIPFYTMAEAPNLPCDSELQPEITGDEWDAMWACYTVADVCGSIDRFIENAYRRPDLLKKDLHELKTAAKHFDSALRMLKGKV